MLLQTTKLKINFLRKMLFQIINFLLILIKIYYDYDKAIVINYY